MIKFTKCFIKKAFNLIGLDILRLSKSPTYSLLGLRNLPIRTIIDVGANEAQFARFIHKIFPEGHIYCFEPLLEPFEKLNQWAEKQKGKVSTYNLALGDKEGTLEMFSHIEHSPSSSFLKTTELSGSIWLFTQRQDSVLVSITTLDRWFKSLSNPTETQILIKLDVQGYEDRVIRGGQEIFNMAKACILEVNLDKLYKEQASFKDISSLLYNFGYYYAGNLNQIYADDGHVIYVDAVFVKK